MSHHVYTTEGVVIDAKPYGEANKIVNIYTEDLGMVSAIAQGIRKSESKLRFHIQDHNFAKISLVKGKEMWRLTGASPTHMVSDEIFFIKNTNGANSTSNARAPYQRLLTLVKRLVHGEERHDSIFHLIKGTANACAKYIGEGAVSGSIERIAVLRLLYMLGYVKSESTFAGILDDCEDWGEEIVKLAEKEKTAIIRAVNNGLKASHL